MTVTFPHVWADMPRELIANGQFGRMITLKGNEIASAPLEEIAGKLKLVTEDNDLVVQGRRMGICFG